MKYTTIALFAIGSLTACSSDKLETAPTDAVSGSTLMDNSNTAIVALNGIYRTFYTSGVSHECFGLSSWTLCWESMAEDMVMGAGGSGWFEWDVLYNIINFMHDCFFISCTQGQTPNSKHIIAYACRII